MLTTISFQIFLLRVWCNNSSHKSGAKQTLNSIGIVPQKLISLWVQEKELTAFQLRADLDGSSGSLNSAGATEFPKWAPLVPQLPPLPSEIPAIRNGGAGAVAVSSQWTGPKELSPSYGVEGRAGRERWSVDDAVTVPQIPLQAPSSKRTRTPVWYY